MELIKALIKLPLYILVVSGHFSYADSSEGIVGESNSVDSPSAEKKLKSNYENDIGFGAKTTINVQLQEEDEIKNPVFRFEGVDTWLQPWFDRKKGYNQKFGVQLGTDYNYMVQHANRSLGEKSASSGIFRVYGKWDLVNKKGLNKGSFFMKLEHRHRYRDIPPASLAGEVGYAGVTGTLFNDVNLVLNEFNWQQYFDEGRTGLIAGRFDPNDYMDVSGYANPWKTFHNLSSLFNTSIALPDTSWGVGFGHWINGSTYFVGSVNDANGQLSETRAFEHGSELFRQVGIGWTPIRKRRYNNNIQITYWDVDKRKHLGIPESDGIAVNANWTFNNTWMLWTRLGWSDGLASINRETYTLGFAKKLEDPTDTFAFSINWGDPAEPGLQNQTSFEVIYKSQFAQNLIFTPSIQYLKNPALNPEEDSITIVGLRVRLSL